MKRKVRLTLGIIIVLIVSSFSFKAEILEFVVSITTAEVSAVSDESVKIGGESISTDGNITEKGVYYKTSSILSSISGASSAVSTLVVASATNPV